MFLGQIQNNEMDLVLFSEIFTIMKLIKNFISVLPNLQQTQNQSVECFDWQ